MKEESKLDINGNPVQQEPDTVLAAIGSDDLVSLVAKANRLDIHKKDIIAILPLEGQFYMVYEAEK